MATRSEHPFPLPRRHPISERAVAPRLGDEAGQPERAPVSPASVGKASGALSAPVAGLAALLALGAIGGGVKAGLGSLPSQHGLDGHAAASQPGGTPSLALQAASSPAPLVAPPARPASAFFTLPGAGPIPAVALNGPAVRGTRRGSPSRPTPTRPYLLAAPVTAPTIVQPAPPSNSPAPTATPAPSAPTPQSQPPAPAPNQGRPPHSQSNPTPQPTGSSAPANQSAPSDQSTQPSQPAPSDQSQPQSTPSDQTTHTTPTGTTQTEG